MKEELGIDVEHELLNGGPRLKLEESTPPTSAMGDDPTLIPSINQLPHSLRKPKARRTKIGEDLIWCGSCRGDLFII